MMWRDRFPEDGGPRPASPGRDPRPCAEEYGHRTLVIGLVNNMPPAARKATEAQYRALLARTPSGWRVRLRVFAAQDVADGGEGAPEGLDALWDARLDGLIVTGTEPRAEAMTDEPGWPHLARLVDWAAENTTSAIWSCMAAHAAVMRLDGLSRRKLPEKLWGVFECAAGQADGAAGHPLLAGAPARWPVPHSRCNTLDEAELRGAGYLVLARAPRVGADLFVRQARGSLFVMAQGHPEYGPDSLPREYRREIRRFLAGQRDTYPEMPEGCFGPDARIAFAALRERACRDPGSDLLSALDRAMLPTPAHFWALHATRLYARWMETLAAGREARAPKRFHYGVA